MVNPVNNSVSQATLNPFQKRIEDQVKNPDRRDTQESPLAAANRSADERQENQPVAAQSARNDNSGERPDSRSQRGSLLDVTV